MTPAFRLDNEQLAFRFTATLSDRYGEAVERLPDPDRLDHWLAANDLMLGSESATKPDLDMARQLREAIHHTGAALVGGATPDRADRDLINTLACDWQAFPELTETGMRWRTRAGRQVRGALSLIAHDAIIILGGQQRSHVKTCENHHCGGLYVDTSQGQNRRWCSMNVCGNRAKKAKFRRSGARTTGKP